MCMTMHCSGDVKSGNNFAEKYIEPAIIESWRGGGWQSTIYSLFKSVLFVGWSVSTQCCVKRLCGNENIKAIFNIIHSVRCVRTHARTQICAHKLVPCYIFRQLNRSPEGDPRTRLPLLYTPQHITEGLDGLD